jgi:threonine/homoserine/homoserine lactone efflux protein
VIPALVRGLAIGFAIAAVIGPIGMLCIRRSLDEGGLVGAATGLGAATADGIYAAVAAFGLTAVSGFLIDARRPLGVIGGCFLVALAVRTLRSGPASASDRSPRSLSSAYASTVALTLANPATILSFAAAFVGLGLAGHDTPTAAALTLGVFAGSAAWWVLLATVVSSFGRRLGQVALRRLAAGSSVLIGVLGLAAVLASLAA